MLLNGKGEGFCEEEFDLEFIAIYLVNHAPINSSKPGAFSAGSFFSPLSSISLVDLDLSTAQLNLGTNRPP